MRIGIIGAGGHGKVVADAVLTAGEYAIAGFFDDDPSLREGTFFGYPLLGPIDDWASHSIDIFIIGIGSNLNRKRQFERLKSAGARFATIVHPGATVGKDVSVGDGTVVLANVVINCDASVGPNTILNTSCTVDHDCIIGPHSHLAPGVNLAGNVQLGEGVFAGVGAKVIPGVRIGEWAVVGAGAVVIDDVQEGSKVVGVPARKLEG